MCLIPLQTSQRRALVLTHYRRSRSLSMCWMNAYMKAHTCIYLLPLQEERVKTEASQDPSWGVLPGSSNWWTSGDLQWNSQLLKLLPSTLFHFSLQELGFSLLYHAYSSQRQAENHWYSIHPNSFYSPYAPVAFPRVSPLHSEEWSSSGIYLSSWCALRGAGWLHLLVFQAL